MRKKTLTIRLFRKCIHFFFRPEIIGFEENIPKNDGALIAANHGGYELDTFTLSCITPRWIHVLYWDNYYYDNWYYYIIQYFKPIPVNIPQFKVSPGLNINNPAHIEHMKKLFKSGLLVGIFPEGDSNTVWEGYRLKKFLPGVSKLSIDCQVPVIPTAIIGITDGVPLIFSVPHPKTPALTVVPAPILLPRKLIIHFGDPVYFDNYYGRTISKEQHLKNADFIRKKVVELLKTHGKGPK